MPLNDLAIVREVMEEPRPVFPLHLNEEYHRIAGKELTKVRISREPAGHKMQLCRFKHSVSKYGVLTIVAVFENGSRRVDDDFELSPNVAEAEEQIRDAVHAFYARYVDYLVNIKIVETVLED